MALQQFNQFEPKLAGLEGNFQAQPRVFVHDGAAVVIGAINDSDANHGLDMTSGGTGYLVDDTVTLDVPAGPGPAAGVITITDTDALDVNLEASINGDLLGSTTIAFVGATNTSYTGLEPGVSAGVTTTGAGTGLQMSLTVAGGVATVLTVTAAGTGYVDGDVILFGTGTFGGAVTMNITIGTGSITNFNTTTVGAAYVLGETTNQAATTSAAGTGFTSTVSNIDIPNTQRRGCCLYVGGAGDIEVVLESGNMPIFVGVPAGSFLPILAQRVNVTNTDATFMLALY